MVVEDKIYWVLFYCVLGIVRHVFEVINCLGSFVQGWDDPYVPRTHEGLLKWKYPEMNSVDFLFEVCIICFMMFLAGCFLLWMTYLLLLL